MDTPAKATEKTVNGLESSVVQQDTQWVTALKADKANELRSSMGEELYEVFVSETEEVITNLSDWVPRWQLDPGDTKLLKDIRRAYHTLKGSSRMAGGVALGDYAWAHEDILNRVLDQSLPRNKALAAVLSRSAGYLKDRLSWFVSQPIADESVHQEIQQAEHFATQEWDRPEESAPVSEPVFSHPFQTSDKSVLPQENQLVREMFLEELPEQLRVLDTQMQRLLQDWDDQTAWDELERNLHTLKGSARMAQWNEMGDLAHDAEEEVLQVRSGQQDKQAGIQQIQQMVDQFSSLAEQLSIDDAIEAVESEEQVPPMRSQSEWLIQPGNLSWRSDFSEKTQDSLLERLLVEQMSMLPPVSSLQNSPLGGSLRADTTHSTVSAVNSQDQVRLPAAVLDDMIENASSLNMRQMSWSDRLESMSDDVGEFGRTVSRLKQLLRALELETEAQIHAGYQATQPLQERQDDFDPLEMDQYSEIQRLSRALSESLNDLINLEGDLSQQMRLGTQSVKENIQAGRSLHQSLMATRLVEVSLISPRLRRIVRQTASELEKQVNLVMIGEDIKLDRHLLQKMTAPIEHLLRNAIAHGLELPEERLAQGKGGEGEVRLSVSHDDSDLVFKVQDDGRGLNPDKLYNKAVEMGLVNVQEDLAEQQILRLILRPGFSTAEQVSQVAGRGVGLDVVNSEVKALGGSLQIRSEPEKGTTFLMRLPLTMAANPVLFVNIEKHSYAIPITHIQGLDRMSGGKIQAYLQQHEPILFNGVAYHLYDFASALGHYRAIKFTDERMYPIIFMEVGEQSVAWVVESIAGRRDVMLHSLGSLFKECRFYSSATIAADGQVVMLPEMSELLHYLQSHTQHLEGTEDNNVVKSAADKISEARILVVDDSITVRKVTEKFLSSEGFQVDSARDGLEALEKLQQFQPDLLLLDIEMPRMDGFEVLAAMRREQRWQSIPVIMISSRTADKHRKHARQLGANDFLGKPYQNAQLLEHIQEQLSQTIESEVLAGETE